MTKQEYYRTKEWKNLADNCKELANNKCTLCGSTENLHAHHLTYKNLGNEKQEDLQCLCKNCHEETHGFKFKERYYSISKLNIKVCYMDLIEAQSKVCHSSRDILLFGTLFRWLDEDNIIKKTGITESISVYGKTRTYKMIKESLKCKLLVKIERGIYMVNPFIIRGMSFKSNEKFESLQKKWENM